LACRRHFKPVCFLGNKLRKCSIPTEELGFDPIYLSVEQSKISNYGVGLYGREIISKGNDSDAEILQQRNKPKIMQNIGHVAETMQYDENEAEIMRNIGHEAQIMVYDQN